MNKTNIYKLRELAHEANLYDFSDKVGQLLNPCKEIIIYGAGVSGEWVKNAIDILGREVCCFLDRNAGSKPEHCGKTVYLPDDAKVITDIRERAIVIISIAHAGESVFREVTGYLQNLGYKNMVLPHLFLSFTFQFPVDRQVFANEVDDAVRVLEMMEDDVSIDTFMRFYKAQATANVEAWPFKTQAESDLYFDKSIPVINKVDTFIDIGAYKGDTLEVLSNNFDVSRYIGFEPGDKNFTTLIETAEKVEKINEIMLLPMGVGNLNGLVKFDTDFSFGFYFRISETGSDTIPLVRLDDIISRMRRCEDMAIKADIEGAEIDMLLGAKRIIIEYKPILMISVYHRAFDLWRIPLMLKEWVPEYKFYIRNYGFGMGDTVLHAIPPEKWTG